MPKPFDIWLILFSLLASTVAVLVTIDFVERIFIASSTAKKRLLPTFALFVGTGIWANHVIISLAFDYSSTPNGSGLWVAAAWGFSALLAYVILHHASQKYLQLLAICKNSLIGGACALAIFYCVLAYINQAIYFKLDNFSLFLSVIFTAGAIAAIILMMFWAKSINIKSHFVMRTAVSFIIALTIVAIHMALNSALIMNTVSPLTDPNSINKQLMGAIIALAFISLFLLLFISTVFLEKHGVKLFKFKLFGQHISPESAIYNTHDSLTKLPNRYGFQQHLKTSAKRSTRAGKTFAVAYIDLDHFKPINDQYGHHIGDEALCAIANQISNAVRACDYVARIGGDEFVAIIEDINSNEDIRPILSRVLSSVSKPFVINNYPIELSCSIGIAIYPKDGDLEKLLVCADAAMYRAKQAGKNQLRFYDVETEIASDHILEMQRDLRLAMANGEFYLDFQPKLDCQTLAPTGAEALIRWRHPTKGIIKPTEFLGIADRFGLTNQINDWVIEECCGTIFRAKQIGIDLNVSINLPQQQFRNSDLVKIITKQLKFYALKPSNITLEIKETTAVTNQEQYKALLAKLNLAGIRVTLDDFGLHPVSLQYLQDLNVKELKLDKVFVSVINDNKASKDLINGVIQLAHALNLVVIAEGVENEAQWQSLAALGCDQMQGFLFSKPVAEEKLFNLFKQIEVKQGQLDLQPTGRLLISDFQSA